MASRRNNRSNQPTEATEVPATTTEESAVSDTTTEAPVEAVVENSTVEPVEPVATESVEVPAAVEVEDNGSADDSTESTENKSDDKKDEKPAEVDLTEFSTALASAIDQRDETTGTPPEAAYSAVNVAYRKLDGAKAKNKAKALITKGITDAMNALDAPLARAHLLVQEHLSASGPVSGAGAKANREPVDPTEAFVERVVTLDLARALVVKPEGVGDEATDKATELYQKSFGDAQTYLEYLQTDEDKRGDEPEVSVFVKSAAKLALGKAARPGGAKASSGTAQPFQGERRDIAKHIENAFAEKEAGTFLTIAAIRNAKSPEYGDDLPSAGAISARLFPKSGKVTIEGVEPAEVEGKKGARKVA